LYWIFNFILFAAILISIFYFLGFLVGRLLLYFPFCCAAVWMFAEDGKNAETCRLITTTKRSINKKRRADGTNSNNYIIIIIIII
jgi:hypothetical protein